MRLYNTASGDVETLELGSSVDIYVCGITPYDSTHLGHAAVFVNFDVLHRRLEDMGKKVRMVRNVTDVDTPLFAKAAELGVHYLDLATEQEARLNDDLVALNVLPAYSTPRASSAMQDMIGMIMRMLEYGCAYRVGSVVYFDVDSRLGFGELSGYSVDRMIQLGAERGEDPTDSNKRNPLDFVLWRPSDSHEPKFPSPWGDGLPGWHIECSALVRRELGPTVDIHGGGSDLVFPHHECERIQSEFMTDAPCARLWMHQAMVRLNGEKMSKSLGNLVFVDALRKDWEPQAIRLAILSQHYRTSWDYSHQMMADASDRLSLWRSSAGQVTGEEVYDKVRARLDDDLDTARALALLDEAAASGVDIGGPARLLGVELQQNGSKGADDS